MPFLKILGWILFVLLALYFLPLLGGIIGGFNEKNSNGKFGDDDKQTKMAYIGNSAIVIIFELLIMAGLLFWLL